ncbi:hypothetical protein Cabys_2447 [Caldithrix abyssi DSM 13497]|uniref:Uncharacterized protein n=1 Tax=Caldithrix abyssi DSM 13497 TaxID=880073 RepID=A0A1J1C9V4_CALAY|nr:hypothetical protein Cabys_2447 [Caldithrix abyssi DSM 13497]
MFYCHSNPAAQDWNDRPATIQPSNHPTIQPIRPWRDRCFAGSILNGIIEAGYGQNK